jgi:hypothetical protein
MLTSDFKLRLEGPAVYLDLAVIWVRLEVGFALGESIVLLVKSCCEVLNDLKLLRPLGYVSFENVDFSSEIRMFLLLTGLPFLFDWGELDMAFSCNSFITLFLLRQLFDIYI